MRPRKIADPRDPRLEYRFRPSNLWAETETHFVNTTHSRTHTHAISRLLASTPHSLAHIHTENLHTHTHSHNYVTNTHPNTYIRKCTQYTSFSFSLSHTHTQNYVYTYTLILTLPTYIISKWIYAKALPFPREHRHETTVIPPWRRPFQPSPPMLAQYLHRPSKRTIHYVQ